MFQNIPLVNIYFKKQTNLTMGQSVCPSVVRNDQLEMQLLPNQYEKYQKQPYNYVLEIMKQIRGKSWSLQIETKYQQFFKSLSSYYNNVPYHNITHGFDVAIAVDKYIQKYGLKQLLNITPEERIHMLIAAYAHDNGHQGLTNNFYINSQDDLAIKYSNVSPLQNMHSSNLMSCVRLHGIQIPQKLKQLMVTLILATDNKHHFELIKKITQYQQYVNKQIIDQLDQEETKRNENNKPQVIYRSVLLQMMIHTADINNCGKSLQDYLKWSDRLYQEFKTEYHKQRQLKLKIHSYQFDFNNWQYTVAKSNLGFFNVLVLPLFKEVQIVMPLFKAQVFNAIKIKNHFEIKLKHTEAKSKQIKSQIKQEKSSK